MSRQRVTVNGTVYDSVVEDRKGQITLSSSKHEQTFITTLEELKTQYGVKQAYFVLRALEGARRQ